MKAEEIQLGNKVRYKGEKEIWTVNGIFADEISCDADNELLPLDSYEPIPITPELLEKCGFVKYKDIKNNIHAEHGAAYFIDHADIRYILCRMWHKEPNYSMKVEYTDSPFPEDNGRNYPICFDVQYLNQLQNLVFALTGTPLTVKL